MKVEPLEIEHAWTCTPQQFGDDRGLFLEWFRADLLAEATGRHFPIAQANHSSSKQGVLRGLHYADVPPGQAKYVYCPRGTVLDVIVDLRIESPTFGRHTTVQLDDVDRRGVFVSEGLGHAFVVLSDTADVTYLVSTAYNPSVEHAVDPLDPELAIAWPNLGLVLSDKDRSAPSLARARADGLLPTYAGCLTHYEQTRA